MSAVVEPHNAIDGVLVVTPPSFRDDRGVLVETWRQEWLPGRPTMVQSNRADRRAGTVVGLHYHRRQADYWYVVTGLARVVLHDVRVGSPTEGATSCFDLGSRHPGSDDHRGLYLPPGVAHGFAACSDVTVTYLVDRTYDPADELGLAWDDPDVGADWAVAEPVLSDRDRRNPARCELVPADLPRWAGPGPS